MRLIDADTLMEAMYHRAFETDGDTMWQSGCWVRYKAIEQTIKAQPEIIRCKDCKYWTKQEDSLQGRCALFGIYPTGRWYCANAKKKGDPNE